MVADIFKLKFTNPLIQIFGCFILASIIKNFSGSIIATIVAFLFKIGAIGLIIYWGYEFIQWVNTQVTR